MLLLVSAPTSSAPSPRPPSLQGPPHPRLPRYWLWYTTKACVGSLARKAWERLRLYRVNLIALQRRRDPEQVLLQCLPRNKVGAAEGWGAGGGVQGVGRPASGSPAPPGGRHPAAAAGAIPRP